MPTDSRVNENVVSHTPGPWRWMDYPDGRKLLLSRDRAVIHCPDAPLSCDPADQRLIAAAPDLLDIAKTTLQYWENTGFADCDQGCDCIVEHMRAAIAKAEAQS